MFTGCRTHHNLSIGAERSLRSLSPKEIQSPKPQTLNPKPSTGWSFRDLLFALGTAIPIGYVAFPENEAGPGSPRILLRVVYGGLGFRVSGLGFRDTRVPYWCPHYKGRSRLGAPYLS